jgi:multidrug efflux pump subunit AcrA (membrane-fusion protein)
MKNRLGIFKRLLPVIVLVAGIGGFMAMGGRPPVAPHEQSQAIDPLVEVVTTQKHDRGLTIKVDGVAVPYRELLLTSKVAGSIEFKAQASKAGRFVKQGTLLLEIDPRDYRLEVKRLQSELLEAEAGLHEVDEELANTELLLKLAQEELTLRDNEVARVLRLMGRNVGSDTELDTAKRNQLQARNSQLTLQNQARLLSARRKKLEHSQALVEVQLEKASLDLERTKIVAPADGVIVLDHVEEGTYVQPGTTLITLEDTSAVEVRCNLRMEELDWLWRQKNPLHVNADLDPVQADYQFPETDAEVIYELGGQRFQWVGKLSRYDGVGLDERTRTVPCRVVVENPRHVGLVDSDGLAAHSPTVSGPPALVRGMFVSVRIEAFPNATLLRLPERAIRPGNEVWLVRDGKLDRVKVHVARVTPEGVLIDAARSDLAEGDQVVTTPLAASPKADGLGYIEEGQPVRVKTVSVPEL